MADCDANTLVSDYAVSKGFPELGEYFATLTLDQLSSMTEKDLIKNVATKHRIQMIGFAKFHLLTYLGTD